MSNRLLHLVDPTRFATKPRIIPHRRRDQVDAWCVPQLKAASGRIVNLSSIAGTPGIDSSVPCVASKGAVNALNWHMARALAPEVRVKMGHLSCIAANVTDAQSLATRIRSISQPTMP